MNYNRNRIVLTLEVLAMMVMTFFATTIMGGIICVIAYRDFLTVFACWWFWLALPILFVHFWATRNDPVNHETRDRDRQWQEDQKYQERKQQEQSWAAERQAAEDEAKKHSMDRFGF